MLRAEEFGQKGQRYFAKNLTKENKQIFSHHVKFFSKIHKEADRPTKKGHKNDKASGGKGKRFSNGTAYTTGKRK